MFGLGQTKKKKETEKKVLGYKKAQQVYSGRPDEDVEAVQRKEHFSRDQGMKQTARDTAKDNANILITETVEGNVRKDQFSREQQEKAVRVQTRKENQDVLITDTVESEVRKEQFSRDQGWKETGRQQKTANTNFDMARCVMTAESCRGGFTSSCLLTWSDPCSHTSFLPSTELFSTKAGQRQCFWARFSKVELRPSNISDNDVLSSLLQQT
jgi:hypothetical protein